jgi:hypothetical protein
MSDTEPCVIYPPSWLGQVDVSGDTLQIGDLLVHEVGSGYPDANVYVQRVSGMRKFRDGKLTDVAGFPIAKIIIEIVGDGTAQQALDAENAEAELYPGGPKEYWRSKGMSEEELAEWDDGDYPEQAPGCPWRG